MVKEERLAEKENVQRSTPNFQRSIKVQIQSTNHQIYAAGSDLVLGDRSFPGVCSPEDELAVAR